VLRNEALDMGVLLYREYFHEFKKEPAEVIPFLIQNFEKTNGMLEAKCYLIRRYIKEMSYLQAN